jgi:hypothetical protein
VQYDVGINFVDQHHGEIVQHLQLDRTFSQFNDRTVKAWQRQIEQRAKSLGGRSHSVSEDELRVSIPFHNGKELETKFNQFFTPKTSPEPANQTPLPRVQAELTIQENNLLFFVRDRLTYDLDLRSFGIQQDGEVLVSPGSLLNLQFSLTTPWGFRQVSSSDTSALAVNAEHRQLTWTLRPGQVNHLEAIFWVPSPLGIGTVAIALVIGLSIYLRSVIFPHQPSP